MSDDLTQGSATQRSRDPEDRPIDRNNEEHKREKAHDKTLADSFPTSDPPSTIPDPSEEDSIDRPSPKDIRPPGKDVVDPTDKGFDEGGSIEKIA